MNILHVIHSLDLETGGPAHAVRHIASCQRDAGHEVGILATTARMAPHGPSKCDELEAYRREPSFEAMKLFFCRSQSPARMGGQFGKLSRFGQLLHRCRETLHPDIIHIHGAFSHLTAAAASWARSCRIPYVNRPAGILNSRCLDQGRTRLKRAFMILSYLPDLRRSAMIQVTSEAERSEVLKQVPEVANRICIIPLGTTVDCCHQEQAQEFFLDAHPQFRGRRVLLYLSRITAKKRPEMLIEACARLRDRHPDLSVLLAGSTDSHEEVVRASICRNGLAERVAFSGHLNGEEKCGAFSMASVFVLPSIDENFGIAVVEAMAHGLPVVTTPGVATHKYVNHCDGGLTVEENATSLAEGIDEILSSPFNNYGERGRCFAREHLSWQSVVSQLCSEYKRAAA